MHRQSGRTGNKEYYLEIECLPDEQLFSPSEIARRKFDKKTQSELYSKMFHAIYQFGARNGLALAPDNGVRQVGGKPIMNNGKAKLKTGERSARWYGKTWKNKLFIEDRQAIESYVQQKLINTLNLYIEKRKLAEASLPEVTESVVAPFPKARPKMKFRLWQVALIAAIVFTAGSVYQYSNFQEGLGILQNQGPKAALNFFQGKGQNYETQFGTAWAAYRNGDYQFAASLCEKVLKSPSLEDQAKASYLLGDLKMIAGKYDEAKEHLLTANAIYQTTSNLRSQYRTQLVLAKLHLAQKDVRNATYYLNLADTMSASDGDEYFLYLKSQVAFLNRDYEAALSLALEREKLAGGDRSVLSGIYSDIGFYYGLLGNLDQCFLYTINAQSIASAQEDASSIMYNNVNMCLYLKCSMRDYSQLQESVLAYARSKKDVALMEQMYFVDKHGCELEQTDNGHIPPPDAANSPLTSEEELRNSNLAKLNLPPSEIE